MQINSRKRTTLVFFVGAFIRLFISSAVLILVLDAGITAYQIFVIKPMTESRIHKFINDNRDVFLNNIALNDFVSLKKDMDILTNELEVDQIVLHYKNKTIKSNTSENLSSAVLIISNALSKTKIISPYRMSLKSDLGNITAAVVVSYGNFLSKSIVLPLITSALLLYFIALIPIGVLFLLLFKRIKESLVQPLQALTQAFSKQEPIKIAEMSDSIITSEISTLINASDQYVKTKLESAEALNTLAAQVTHDINSPLIALDIAARDLSSLPEKKQTLIREATKHIKDIIHNLGDEYRQAARSDEPEITPLMKMVDYVVSEKSLMLPRHIQLKWQFSTYAHTIFVKVVPQELKRVLSNIINNAIDASAENGVVTLQITSMNSFARITISDSGSGIPTTHLGNIFDKAVTYKEGGKGLGLYHAKQNITKWGGTIVAESQEGQGTTIIIELPSYPPEEWYATGFSLFIDTPIIIIDDSKEMHTIWKDRFRKAFKGRTAPKIISFYSPHGFTDWYKNKPVSRALYLVDYDFGGSNKNGIDIIRDMSPDEPAIIVTSRSDKNELHNFCITTGRKLLPKYFVADIPISIIDKKPEVVSVGLSDSQIALHIPTAVKPLRYDSINRFMSDARLLGAAELYISKSMLPSTEENRLLELLNQFGFSPNVI